MSWTLLADGVVAILLVATIVYVRRFSTVSYTHLTLPTIYSV